MGSPHKSDFIPPVSSSTETTLAFYQQTIIKSSATIIIAVPKYAAFIMPIAQQGKTDIHSKVGLLRGPDGRGNTEPKHPLSPRS